MRYEELTIEGRNAVLEAFRSGKTIDKLFVLDGCQDGPVRTIVREAKKYDTIINYVAKERLDQMSETGKHQGVIAYAAAYEYAEVEDMLKLAEERENRLFYTKTLGNLEKDCDTALQKIDNRMYAKEYEDDYDQILYYGISFFKKRCMVREKLK